MSTKIDRKKSLFDANEPHVCSKIQFHQLKAVLEPSCHYSRYQETRSVAILYYYPIKW